MAPERFEGFLADEHVTRNPIDLPVPDLEALYNNRAAVPEHPAVLARWKDQAERARVHQPPLVMAYGERPREVLDFWEAGTGAPVAVFIHGGYWQALDRSWFSWVALPLVERGISVAIPSYDLCPEVSLSRIIHQMRTVTDLLRRRPAQEGSDRQGLGRRPFVFGHSAGGHLAACLLSEGRVSGALSISGLFDLEPLVATSLNEALRLDFTMARALSPIHWPAPSGGAPGGMRLDCLVGGAETPAFQEQSARMADHWALGGAQTRLQVLEGLNHFTVLDPLADPDSDLVGQIAEMAQA